MSQLSRPASLRVPEDISRRVAWARVSLSAALCLYRHSAADKQVRAAQFEDFDRLDVLPQSQRLFIDVIRMIAYRAEMRKVLAVVSAQGKKPIREKRCWHCSKPMPASSPIAPKAC